MAVKINYRMGNVKSYYISKEMFKEIKHRLDGFVYWKEHDDCFEIKIVMPNKYVRDFLEKNCLKAGLKK